MYADQLFNNKVVLVTGGRSGIGFAIAALFLHYGASVVICSRKEEALKQAAEKLNKLGTCYAFPCDIRKPEEIETLADFIKEKTGRLDILINNAGGQFPAPANVMAAKGWAAVINNNLNGTFYMSQKMANSFFIPTKKALLLTLLPMLEMASPVWPIQEQQEQV